MKKYLVKSEFDNLIDYEKAKRVLVNFGIDSRDIACLITSFSKKSGFYLKKRDKGPLLSVRFMIIGLFVGSIFHLVNLFSGSTKSFWASLENSSVENFLLVTMGSGFIFWLIGMFIGQKFSFYSISYGLGKSDCGAILMNVKVNFEHLERTKIALNNLNSKNIDVSDLKREVEVGLRFQ